MSRRLILSLVLVALGMPQATAQRDLKDIPDPDPELERKSFRVAEGFEVNLFASDPLLAKPIQMNFDARGRLWVASSQSYPQLKVGEKANDKILILEDKNGDGKADETTVFADGLLMPTGVEPGDGGAYVANSTELVHLSKPDASGKATKRRVVLSGFGTEDTHHIIHTFRWGPDGAMYFNQSIYIHSHIETPHGVRRLNAGGIWQLRPSSYKLEVFARGWVNAWGHSFDRFGQSFVTDGAGGEGINYVVPGAYYPTAQGAKRLMHGLNPGSPKYCGLEVLSGRHLPESWRGNLLTNDFRGHRVCRFVVVPDGSGYVARQQPDLISTKHAAFRPIDLEMGPDGAIYIADWYNPIIQHGEVDFRDPRRDRTHGRIWRVTAKGRPLVPRPKLVEAKTEALLESLKAEEGYTRRQARRVLQERGKSVIPALEKWVGGLGDSPETEAHRLQGLWVYQSLDEVSESLLRALLRAKDARVRAASVRVLDGWGERVKDRRALLTERVRDGHPQVRLEAVRALAHIREARSAELALTVLDRRMDKFLDYALWLTLQELEPVWLPELRAGRLDFGGKTNRLAFALKASGSGAVVPTLVRTLKSSKLDPEAEAKLLVLLAEVGGTNELDLILSRLREGKEFGTQAFVEVLEAVERAVRTRKVSPPKDMQNLEGLLHVTWAKESRAKPALMRLAGAWKLERVRSLTDGIFEMSADHDEESIAAAVDALVSLDGRKARKPLSTLAEGKKNPLALRRQALLGLSRIDLDMAAGLVPEVVGSFENAVDSEPIFRAFLQQKKGPTALASELRGHTIPADVAKVGLRVVRSQGREFPPLIDALQKAGQLTEAKPPTAEEVRRMVAEVMEQGDAKRGEQIYRRVDMLCQKCHAIGGAGGQVGPDLSTVGASAQVDYLVESLLLPNKAVKENYNSLVVATNDGQVFTGVKVRENKDELVLRTAEDREVVIATKDIDEKSDGKSLMPVGLVSALTRPELLDLVRFLSELGKVGPFSVGRSPVVRRWEVLTNDKTSQFVLRRKGLIGATEPGASLTWEPAYSTVSGSLPLLGLPRLASTLLRVLPPAERAKAQVVIVRCQVDVTTAGPVEVKLNDVEGFQLWLDQTPVDVKPTTTLTMPTGLHTLTFAVKPAVRKTRLRCEVSASPKSSARVRVVGGK